MNRFQVNTTWILMPSKEEAVHKCSQLKRGKEAVVFAEKLNCSKLQQQPWPEAELEIPNQPLLPVKDEQH